MGINETYITVLENIFTGATARVNMDNQVSENNNTESNGKQNKARSFDKNKSRLECSWEIQSNLSGQALSRESKNVFAQCVLPAMAYGYQTWSLTKALVQKLETSQRAME